MSAEDIGIGIAGVGAIGRVHSRNLLRGLPGARLVRASDPSAEARRSFADLCNVQITASYEEMLADPRVQAVIVASPPDAHPAMVELAADAGKHILCEKPLALDIESGERAVAAVERAGTLLQVGFHRRFDRDFVEARSRVERGELGKIYSLFGSMRDREPPSSASVTGPHQMLIHDAACHDLDAARWLVGEIDEVTTIGASAASAPLRAAGQIDHAITVMRFESGALGQIDNSLASGYGFDCRCEIVGSGATLRVDAPYVSNVERVVATGSGFMRTATFLDRFADSYPKEVEAFAAAIRDGGEAPASGEDGLAATVLATAAQRSFETGRTVRLRRSQVGHGLRYSIDESSDRTIPRRSA